VRPRYRARCVKGLASSLDSHYANYYCSNCSFCSSHCADAAKRTCTTDSLRGPEHMTSPDTCQSALTYSLHERLVLQQRSPGSIRTRPVYLSSSPHRYQASASPARGAMRNTWHTRNRLANQMRSASSRNLDSLWLSLITFSSIMCGLTSRSMLCWTLTSSSVVYGGMRNSFSNGYPLLSM